MSEKVKLQYFIFAISALLASAGDTTDILTGPKLGGKIAGGEPVALGQFPGVLSLGLSSWGHIYHMHHCAGSIVTESWVLTSAECVESAANDTNLYYWLAGTNNLNQLGIQHTIRRIVLHPEYNANDSWIHDIALVQVNEPFEFSDTIQPVELWSLAESPAPVGTEATVIGWGQISPTLIQPTVLQKAAVQIVDDDFCREAYDRWDLTIYDEYQFCAGPANDEVRGACSGDAGGPIFLGNGEEAIIIGIVSWSYGCGDPDYPAVYVRVAAYLDWIYETTGYL